MNKKLFVLLVVLMSLSLIGIIFVQGFWIKKSVADKEEQFSNAVSQVLGRITEKVEQRERRDYYDRYFSKDSLGEPVAKSLKEILFINRDLKTNITTRYSHGILEESYDIASTFFDNGSGEDTTTISNFTSTRTKIFFNENLALDGQGQRMGAQERLKKVNTLTSVEKAKFDDVFSEYAKLVPIHRRVSKQELELLLERELSDRALDVEYEYGIYSKGLPTTVKSRKFKFAKSAVYKAPIFEDADGDTDFSLLLTFPKKKTFLIQSILGMAVLSLLFTLVIVASYSGAIYQLIRQKQISEIKSDFINNMTHEFKTPIATINLAVEAIKNPKTISDKEKVMRYLGMIRDENKRMHAQVENVLRISRLEKNQLDIRKDRVDVHDIILDAIAHVELIVQDRGGYIQTHLDAKRTEVLANEMHFTNVIINILDNAVKYSTEAPNIDVFTELAKNFIIIKVQDKGAGMSKAVLKKVFEKFYREHTGNIHNVKGHGLGLSYVKKIVDDHQGEVYAESEKGKGSTFYIKMPLI